MHLALVIAVIAYVALALALFLGQARLLYLPDLPGRTLAVTPASIGLGFESLEFTAEDGVRLHGWHVRSPNPRGTILFFHGNAGNISHRLDSVRIFHDLGFDVLIFDYRGYGRSEGRPDEDGLHRDAMAAWRELVERRSESPARIVLFGRSLGASVAAWLAARVQPGALILESAFTSVPDLAAEIYWWLPVRWLARLDHATVDHLADVRCPVLIVHSPDDEIVPVRHGRALYKAAAAPKAFLALRGDHNRGFLVSGDVYPRGLESFLGGHLPRGSPR